MAKSAAGITTLAAKNLKVEGGKQYARIYDGAGLFLRCTKRGAKVWRFRFKNSEGKERWLTLGEFPAMTVKEARQEAGEYHNKVMQGIDPKLEMERKQIETQERGTFHEAALRWLDHSRHRLDGANLYHCQHLVGCRCKTHDRTPAH